MTGKIREFCYRKPVGTLKGSLLCNWNFVICRFSLISLDCISQYILMKLLMFVDSTAVVGHGRSGTVSQSHSVVHPRLICRNCSL